MPTLPAALTDRLDVQSAMFATRMRQGLLAASVAIGLDVLDELLETEVTGLAGPKGKHDAGRSHKRHGSVDGPVTLGGRQVAITRLRVRTADAAEATLGADETRRGRCSATAPISRTPSSVFDRVCARLGGVTRRWRFDRMGTVVAVGTDRILPSFASFAKLPSAHQLRNPGRAGRLDRKGGCPRDLPDR